MYVGIDIGGTKTLVAVLDEHGVITEHDKFPTPDNYDDFLKNLETALSGFKTKDFKAGGVGVPATQLDRKHGIAVSMGNLSWSNVPIQDDTEKIFQCPLVIENDAKLGGLSEAMLVKDTSSKVLYVTIGTGIGVALVNGGVIDTNIGDGGGRTMLIEYQDKMIAWEDFAGGRAIAERYGKKAAEITDEATWRTISRNLAKGLIELIAITQPEVIIIGGGVGAYFDRYKQFLSEEIEKYRIPIVKLPRLIQAQRPEEAVIYGCYDLAKQVYGHGKTNN